MAYLKSVFPGQFPASPARPGNRADPAFADRLAGWAYGSERAWSLERDSLFQHAWQIVGHESQVARAGDFLTADLGLERVLLVRDGFGRVHALRNSCPQLPHALVEERRGRLAEGIDCALHGLRFAEDGKRIAGVGADLAALEILAADGFYWVRSAALAGGVEAGGVEAGRGEAPGRPVPRLGDAFQVHGQVLEELPDVQVNADWKLVAEQWLERLRSPSDAAPGSDAIETTRPLAESAGWSASHYRRLVGAGAAQPWTVRFVAPNHLAERRPDGLSLLQLIPTGPGQCRIRRIHLAAASVAQAERGCAAALQYLAARVAPGCRRASLAIAESAQRGLSEFGYRASGAAIAPAVAWFRRFLAARLPALAAERAPSEPRQMHYNRPPA
jgi:nitrite reductase/ring-hydroxylating ferredoxin subunit